MKLSLETKIWTGFVVTLLALTVIAFATYRNKEQVEEANQLIRHSHEVTQCLNRVVLFTVDIETGARGYLLTHDERQLRPYDSGRENVRTELVHLRQLISDNAKLTICLDTLDGLVYKKISILEHAVDLAKQATPLSEILKGSTGEGRVTMEAIRALAGDMQKDEIALLTQRQESERGRSQNQLILMVIGNLLVLLILGLAGFSIHRDIARRQKAERELQDGLTFLDSVVENIPNMVFVKDAEHLRFVRFNRAGEKLLGVTQEKMIGKSDYDFFPKEQADFFIAHDRKVLANRDLLDIPEEPIETQHMGTRILHTKKIPVFGQKGQPLYLLGISEDITERKEAEKDLKQLNDALQHHVLQVEATNKELEAFSYSISHDLRTPLRSISGFSQALLEEYSGKLDVTGQDYLNRVRASANRMAILIDDILQLSRVTRSEMNKQHTELSAIARDIISDLQAQQPERHVTVTIEDGLTTDGDHVLLRAALENLLGNAWKYTSKMQHATIEFGMTMQDNQHVLFIRDNGVGFDMVFAGKLFGAFERLHNAEEFEGTGIGLATVKRIVNRHGGTIWAESAVNSGATFYFTFETIGKKGDNYAQQDYPPGRGQSGRRTADAASA